MKVLDAIRNLRITFAPLCVQHLNTIADLQVSLHTAKRRLDDLRRRYDEVCSDRDRLNSLKLEYSAELGAVLEKIQQLAAAGAEVSDELTEERARREMLREQLSDAAAMLEEANARNAVLEQQLRDLGETDEQLALLHAPATDTDAGGVIPNLQGKVVAKSRQMGAVYRLIGLFFEGRHFWLFSIGEQRIKAPINDKDFIDRMHRHEVAFAAGDAIRCDVVVTTYRTAAGDLYAEYVIEKVYAVIPPAQQVPLIETAEVASV